MCDCLRLATVFAGQHSGSRGFQKLGIAQCSLNIKPVFLALEMLTWYKGCCFMQKVSNKKCRRVFRKKLGVFGSNGFDLGSELRLKDGGNENFELSLQSGLEKFEDLEQEASDNIKTLDSLKKENPQNGDFGLLDFDEPLEKESEREVSKAKDYVSKDSGENGYLEYEEDEVEDLSRSKPKSKHKPNARIVSKSSKQLMKRSSILAKQVIGIESACNLGFVTQLWVDISTWAVVEVEVKPNLLSSESGRLLLQDINKVGDVVLVNEENYVMNEFRTVGLETLVGYSVLTSRGTNLGKVRGYAFNINSGTVDSLELDAFGYSIIPSTLVSTYALFAEEVVEVVSDVIIVHEEAALRIQRLTKGLLGIRNRETSRFMNVKYHDLEEKSVPPVKDRNTKRKARKRKFYPATTDLGNDFELPMDYM